jgi:hypothetical protein
MKPGKGYERIIDNHSGMLDMEERNGGVWIVVEDSTDICSVGLDRDEVKRLVARLAKLIE